MFLYKTSAETRSFTVSFADSVTSSETILLAGLTISVTNLQTSGISTSSIYVPGSLSFAGTDVSFRFQAGEDDSAYSFVVSTGAVTTSGNIYSKRGALYVTDDIQTLVDLDELKDYLGITSTSTDAVLLSLLRGASTFVQRYIGRDITYQRYTETFYPEESSVRLCVTNFPLDAVESISIDGVTLDASTGGYANYVAAKEGFVRRLDGGRFSTGNVPTVITYRAGFKAVPEDLRTVVKKLISSAYNQRLSEGLLEEELGTYRVKYASSSAMSEDSSIKDVLNGYIVRVL